MDLGEGYISSLKSRISLECDRSQASLHQDSYASRYSCLHSYPLAMKLLICIISLISFLLPTIAAPLEPRALQPAFDPFYTPPQGWESQPVGTILDTRPIIPAALGVFPNLGLQGWQLLYRTQGANGEPLTTVTTILKPFGAKTDRLLAYTFAEDGNNRKCAPSYNCE